MLKKSINFSHSVSSVSFAKQQGLSGHPNDNAEYQITLYDQGMDVKSVFYQQNIPALAL